MTNAGVGVEPGGADWGPTPTTLRGARVELRPLTAADGPDLLAAAQDPEIWRYLSMVAPRTDADIQQFIDAALTEVRKRVSVVFATVDLQSGRAVGSTRYMDIQRYHRGLEIGWTWLGREAQRTAINTECKYLLLRHAFEDLGAIRVALKTDDRNERSKAAILRIGASFEGVLRCHRILLDGVVRDSAYFSVVHHDWPRVRAALEKKLGR